jgi:hypothetical protein
MHANYFFYCTYPTFAARIQIWKVHNHVEVGGVHQGIVELRVTYGLEERTVTFTCAVVVHHVKGKSYKNINKYS